MSALAHRIEDHPQSHAANDDCFNGGPSTRTKYTYDGVGNRLTRVHGVVTQTLTYTASSNRLATHDGNTVTFDAAGNTLANSTENLSFTYGAHNRMLDAYAGGVLQASFVYNAQGQRLKKVEATGAQRTIVYHYGPTGELIGETLYTTAGAKVGERDYVWVDTLPLAQSERVFSGGTLTSSQFVYVHADQLNTPRLATNAAGTVVWRWDSDAFGLGAANLDPDADTIQVNVRLRFPGQYADEETGLHYNYFRDYDAVTGRYIESDPIGLDGGINTYAYVNGSPISLVDPLGLQSRTAPRPYYPGPFEPFTPGTPAYNHLVDLGTQALDDLIDRVKVLVCPDDNEFCHTRFEQEAARCFRWSRLGAQVIAACQERAADRRTLCIRNGGRPNPEEPPEYNPFVDYPR